MTMIGKFGLLFCFSRAFVINCNSPAGAQLAIETLKYEIIKDDDKKFKVKLTLDGTSYSNSKKCRIMRSNEAEITAAANPSAIAADLKDIDRCPTNSAESPNKCVIDCKSDGNKLTYDKLSPRTQYIYVYSGTVVQNMIDETPKKGGKVFGFIIPLMINPQFSVSTTTEDSKKLKFSTVSCPPVNCPIFYKDIEYKAGTKVNSCVSPNPDNEVGFDLLLPHYEIRCKNYPSFYYYMPNSYMKKEIEIYKPQFYAVLIEENKVEIKFSNSPLSEICLFSIKSGLETDVKTQYQSICGKRDSACYAPCKNVVLDGLGDKKIYKILIQTRHHDIKASEKELNGYLQTKFVNNEPKTGFLTSYTSVGVTFDGTLFKSDGKTIFDKCTLKYYDADKPKPTSLLRTQCQKGDKSGNEDCKDECSILVIQQLAPGRAYIIEIQDSGINDPNGFFEKIFIRTKKSDKTFENTAPTKTDQTAILTSVGGSALDVRKTEPTCEYFISATEKNSFYPAKCLDSNPCRGLCRDQVTIKGLEPNTSYDIKVIAHKDYDIKIYNNIKTDFSTLVIKHTIQTEGLFLNAQMAAVNPGALCIYTIKIKNGNDYADAYTCPLITIKPNPSPSKIPSSSLFNSPINSLNARYNNSQKINPQRKDGEIISTQFSSLNKITQKSVSSSSGGSTTNSCSSNPLCSSIIYQEYDANKEYKILVTAIDKSTEKVFILKPTAPKSNPTNPSKLIKPTFKRENDNFIITNILPTGMDDKSTCKWMVRNISVKSKPIVKSCMGAEVDGCTNFENCKQFTINDLPDGKSYLLTVYKADDMNVFGSEDIQEGATSSSSSTGNTKNIIIVVSAVTALVILIIGVMIVKKKKSE